MRKIVFPKKWTPSEGLGVHGIATPAGKAGSNSVFHGLGNDPRKFGEGKVGRGPRRRIGPIVPRSS